MRIVLALGIWGCVGSVALMGCGGGAASSTGGGSGASTSAGGGSGASTSAGGGGNGSGGGGGSGGSVSFDPDAPVNLATDVTIERIWALQAVAIPVAEAGAALPHATPIVASRDLALRVFLGSLATPRPVTIEVVLEPQEGAPTVLSVPWDAGTAGQDSALGTTPLVVIPAARVQPGLRYAVRVLDAKAPLAQPGQSNAARFPLDGSRADLGAGPVPTLPITLVPLRWDADGSMRLPDTGPAALETMRSLLATQYPVHEVVLTVHPAIPYNHGLNVFGNVDFNDVNDLLYDLRAAEAPPGDVYYYGILKPATSFSAYCDGSCTTGQSYTVTDPTSDDIRLGGGVAFDAAGGAATLGHELGHMFGRYHAPCGVKSWDAGYPYPFGVIGVWGWDPRNASLKDPDVFTDFMGYCDDEWVSDYTYRALHERMLAIGLPKSKAASPPSPASVASSASGTARVRVVHVSAAGQVSLGRRVSSRGRSTRGGGSGGVTAQVRWLDAAGHTLAIVPARAARSGHDGDYSLFAEEVPGAARAEVAVSPRW